MNRHEPFDVRGEFERLETDLRCALRTLSCYREALKRTQVIDKRWLNLELFARARA